MVKVISKSQFLSAYESSDLFNIFSVVVGSEQRVYACSRDFGIVYTVV